METKDKVDLLSKRSEVINKKLLALLLIDGGIWIYGVKENGLLGMVALCAFFFTSIAVIFNILKLGDIEKRLKDMENE